MTEDATTFSDAYPDGLLVVAPGEGQPIPGPGPLSIIARQGWSDGHVLIFEQQIHPGTLMPAHRHTDETQGAYVMAGTIGFWVDGEEVVAGPGSYVVRPAGSVHALWNAGEDVARMLEITTPAERYQAFVLGLAELAARSNVTHEALAEHGARYGTTLAPEVTAELTQRLGLAR
jgi:uncharacterized cupin superfamily protein